ncbi:MAG: hypothetical protein HQ471_04100 [Flavobacteriales bacterium]|nr:hypothetical protein [Flavobacteriales bacterium]
MKKLIYLFLTVLIVSFSSDDGGGSNDGCPINFECSNATANDFLNLEMVTEDYQSAVNAYGEPISEGLYQNIDGGYYYSWSWGDDNCLSVSCSDCSYIIWGGC